MTFQIPWLIAGVSEVPLTVARAVAYLASGGKEGIAKADDLRVRQLATAGSSVRVAAGTFTTISRFTNQLNQSYIGYNDSEVNVAVPANSGTGTRYDLVYVHITDPGQAGQPATAVPAQPRVHTGVTQTARTLTDVPALANQTGYALARLAVPAGTSTITDAMITDLREVVHPKRQQEQVFAAVPAGSATQNLTSATMVVFPSQATWTISVPVWATHAQTTAIISGYALFEGGTAGANIVGSWQIQLGTMTSTNVPYDHSVPPNLGQYDASGATISHQFYLDPAIRGTTQTIRIRADRAGMSTTGANIQAKAGTTVTILISFVEKPETGA